MASRSSSDFGLRSILGLLALGLLTSRCAVSSLSGSPGENPDAGATSSAGAANDAAGQGGSAGSFGDPAPDPETLAFVTNKQTQPLSQAAFAADLDGDGTQDNQYGGLLTSLSGQGFSPQNISDAETAAGRGLQLLALTVRDSNLATSPDASVNISRVADTAAPNFGGMGRFAVDANAPTTTLLGAIKAGQFLSSPVALGSKPPQLLLRLVFGVAVDIPVELYSITYHVTASGLSTGQIDGAILDSDVNKYVPAALAESFNRTCSANPMGQTCKTALSAFDTNKDHVVSAAELEASTLIETLLQPDVKLLDEQGRFAPDPRADVKDSFSLGLGFTAVPAASGG